MAYSERARELRRCRATTKDGWPRPRWAVWGDAWRRCATHGGRRPAGWRGPIYRTNYPPCTCVAYAWPHRPGGGLCRWPDPPELRCTIPPGTHAWPRGRWDTTTGALIRLLQMRWRV